MPYNNPYNRAIANTLHDVNERYAHLYAYSPVDGRGGYALDGGSSAGVLFQIGNASKRDGEDNIVNDNMELPDVYYYGNDAEMKGGSGFAEGTFRDRGDGFSEGVASGNYLKGGNLFGDIYSGFEDLGTDIGKAVEYLNPFGSGRPADKEMKAKLLGRMFGKMMKEAHEMKGGSWWDSLKEGISDAVGFIPDLVIHGLGKEMEGGAKDRVIGGAILGNPDPYPVKGNSERIAGRGKISKKERDALKSVLEKHPVKRGRGRPRKQLLGNNGELLAMPAPVALPNGVPPKAQLRGQYGGGKPSVKEAVMKAVEKKLKGGKNLSGMTDKRDMSVEGTVVGSGDGRKARAEIVRKIMKERGVKMIEASKIVKAEGLYKK
jgi:hypothetical protein